MPLVAAMPTENAQAYGVVLEDLASGERVVHNEDRVFASGSVYKLPLAWEVLHQVDLQRTSLDSTLEILDGEAEPEGGFAPGDTPATRDALRAMLSVSGDACRARALAVARPSRVQPGDG